MSTEGARDYLWDDTVAVPQSGRTCRYLVTIRDVGNITDDPRNIHTILTSTDFIAPRERVTVSLIETLSDGDGEV